MSGRNVGKRNGMARDPDHIVRAARRLVTAGLSCRQVAEVISASSGREIPSHTVWQWAKGYTRASA